MARRCARLFALSAGVCVCLAVEPRTNATNSTKPDSLSRLEALVGQLYNLQSSRAERNTADSAEPLLILDDASARRQLQSRCVCDAYLSGASASSSILCGKTEAGRVICRPTGGTCPSDQTLCSSGVTVYPTVPVYSGYVPVASPQARLPSELEFVSAETTPTPTKLDSHLVNVNFNVRSTGGLPTAEVLKSHLADTLGVPPKHVSLQLVPATAGNQATVQATIAMNSANKQAQAQATLAEMRTLALDATTIDVQQIDFRKASSALVCDEPAEMLKAEAFDLFSRYLDLKSAEVDLLQDLATRAASPSAGCSSCAPLQLFASHLGLSR